MEGFGALSPTTAPSGRSANPCVGGIGCCFPGSQGTSPRATFHVNNTPSPSDCCTRASLVRVSPRTPSQHATQNNVSATHQRRLIVTHHHRRYGRRSLVKEAPPSPRHPKTPAGILYLTSRLPTCSNVDTRKICSDAVAHTDANNYNRKHPSPVMPPGGDLKSLVPGHRRLHTRP